MTKLDANKLALMVVFVLIATLAVAFGYRIEISPVGLTFEKDNLSISRSENID